MNLIKKLNYFCMNFSLKSIWLTTKWILRGKPTKKVYGGWCGCCGKWIPNAEFEFRDYHEVDRFWDLNTICSDKCDPIRHK